MQVTLELIKKLLFEDYSDVEITDFDEGVGSKRGDNYTSMVFRVYLKGFKKWKTAEMNDFERWEHTLIYKCLPENEERREAYKSDNLFQNEVAFYTKIWPMFVEFQKRREGNVFDCIPKCYLPKDDLIILDDLRNYGFRGVDRKKFLDLSHCYAVLNTLAQFHALSLSMKFQYPKEFSNMLNLEDSISEMFFKEENADWYKDYFGKAIQNASAMIQKQLQDDKHKTVYLSKFEQFFSEDFYGMMQEFASPKEPLAVITHGDFWAPNILFKYEEDDGSICEVKLIDFQMVRYASPALDVSLLLYLCISRRDRDRHLPALISFYLDRLHERAVQLTDPDSIFHSSLDRTHLGDLFNEEFRERARFGLGMALDMIPALTCDSDEAPNVYQESDSTTPASAATPVLTTNEECQRRFADLLCELVDNELL